MASPNHIQITIPKENVHQNPRNISVLPEAEAFAYSQRAQWLRAAVLGANDGLVSIASLMMGVGAVEDDVKAMILAFFAGLFASAFSMAAAEFVCVYSQLDKGIAQRRLAEINGLSEENVVMEKLFSPFKASVASALSFALGAFVPLLAAAFITDYSARLVVVVVVAAATTMALVVFGGIGAVLGRARVAWSCARMLVGGWIAMVITFGLTQLLGTSGLKI